MEFFYSKDINVSKLMFFVYNYAQIALFERKIHYLCSPEYGQWLKRELFFFTITKLIWESRKDGINSCRMWL